MYSKIKVRGESSKTYFRIEKFNSLVSFYFWNDLICSWKLLDSGSPT